MSYTRAVLSGVVVCALLVPSAALAYVGPGAGLSMIGSLLAVAGALLLAVLGLVLFPVRLLMKRRRTAAAAASTNGDAAVGTSERADR